MDVSGATVSRYENGKRKWDRDYLEKFSAAIGCDLLDPVLGPPGQLPAVVHQMRTLSPENQQVIEKIISAIVIANEQLKG
jgi:hypothetical protein